jgi:hypothetical protein
VREDGLEGAAGRAPPAAAAGGVVACRGRRAIVRGEFTFVPATEERVPRQVVVRVEARLRALVVAHALEYLVDGGVEGGAHWRRRDRDVPRAQTPASGCAEVRQRRVARNVEQPALPLVQGAPAEAIVGRAVVGAVARHCSIGGGGEWIGEKGVNAAGQTRGRTRYIGGRALTSLAVWLHVRQRQAFTARGRRCMERRRCAEDDAMRTMTALSRRQVGATGRAGTFLAHFFHPESPSTPRKAENGLGSLDR